MTLDNYAVLLTVLGHMAYIWLPILSVGAFLGALIGRE